MTIQIDFPYVITRDEMLEYRTLKCAAIRKARKAIRTEAAKRGRQASYWQQALRFQTFKVGGLRFIKLGRLSVSLCLTQPHGEG